MKLITLKKFINIKNFTKIILKIISYNVNIFINFSPKKIYFLNLFPEEIYSSNKIFFTHDKNILEIMNIINSCDFITGNETGQYV